MTPKAGVNGVMTEREKGVRIYAKKLRGKLTVTGMAR